MEITYISGGASVHDTSHDRDRLNPFPDVWERIARIIFMLCQTVQMRVRVGALTQEQVSYIVGRLLGIRRRVSRLVERIRAGKPPKERVRTPRPRPAEPAEEFPMGFRPPPRGWRRWAPRADKPVPLWRALRPHMFAWLCAWAPAVPRFGESAASCGGELRHLLAEPEMRARLLSSRRAGDCLRPVCWMLGVETSLLYPPPPVAACVAAPSEVSVPTPDALGSAMDPAATAVALEKNRVPGGAVSSPPNVAGAVSSTRASPDARLESEFFPPG